MTREWCPVGMKQSFWRGLRIMLVTVAATGCHRPSTVQRTSTRADSESPPRLISRSHSPGAKGPRGRHARTRERHARLPNEVLLRLPPSGRTSVPFRKGLNHVLVEVRGGRGMAFTFFLDTGASLSVITPEFLRAAKLPVVDGVEAGATVGAHGALRGGTRLRELGNLWVGGLRIDRARAAVVDLKHIAEAFGEPIHGILGFNVLSQLITVIDYPAGRVTFLDPQRRDHLHRMGPPRTIVPFELRKGSLIEVRCSVNGSPEAPFLFDIGARGTILNGAAARAAGVRFTRAVDSRVRGSRGRRRPRRGRVASFRVGSLKFVRPLLRQLDLPVFRHLGMASQPGGIVGNDILGEFRVAIDYGRRRLLFWRR